MATKLGAHVQHWGPETQGWIRVAHPYVNKWLELPRDQMAEVHGWGGINIARVDLGLSSLDIPGIVGRIVNTHASYGDLVDYYELWNEPSCNGSDLDKLNSATLSVFDTLEHLGVKVKILVGCLSEGNPADLNDWPRFYPAMRRALASGGGIALHEYDAPTLTSSGDWRVLRYRHAWSYWPADLKQIPIFLTEFGIDGGVIGQNLFGWQHFTSTVGFLAQLKDRDVEFCRDNGGNRPNLRGVTLYTVGWYAPWQSFDVAAFASLAQYIGSQRGVPIGPPIPPPVGGKVDVDLGIPYETNFTVNRDAFAAGQRKVRLLFIHSTDGQSGSDEADYYATIGWFDNPSSQVSAHFVAGPNVGQVTEMVHDTDDAWAEAYDNIDSDDIELAKTAANLDRTPFTDWQYDVAARYAAWLHRTKGLPLARVFSERDSGIIGHRDSEQGKSCGKIDPGVKFDWNRLIGLAKHYAGENDMTDAQKAAVLDHLNTIWGFSWAEQISKNPKESEASIHERVLAIKQVLGL